jgi:hypothetical protein
MTSGPLNITGNNAILLNTDSQIVSTGTGIASNLRLLGYGGVGITVQGQTGYLGVLNAAPSVPLDVAGDAQISGGLTVANLNVSVANAANLIATSATIPSLLATTATIPSLTATNITTTSILGTNAQFSSLTISSLALPNINTTNITTATLNATGITAANLLSTSATITSLIAPIATITSSTISSLLSANINTTNITAATLNVTGITSGPINITGNNSIILNIDAQIASSGTGSAANLNLTSYGGSGITIAGNSGYLGIGVTPNAPLQLASVTANRKVVLYDITNNDHEYYGLGINNNTLRYQTNSLLANHVFYAASSASSSLELMRIQGNGLVGINNANPVATLDVVGGIAASNISSGSIVINTSGNLSIKNTANSTGLGTGGSLTVLGGGSIGGDLYVGGAVNTSSDIRLKENIIALPTCLDKIDILRPCYFNYTNDPNKVVNIGFIANDFETDFPEILKQPEGGFYSLDYSRVTSILVKCVQEMKVELAELKAAKCTCTCANC